MMVNLSPLPYPCTYVEEKWFIEVEGGEIEMAQKTPNQKSTKLPGVTRSRKTATERKVAGGGSQSTTSSHARNRTALNEKAHRKIG